MAIDMTQAVRIKTIVNQDGVLILTGPFRAGENVEVIVLSAEGDRVEADRYPLRGASYSYTDPFGGAAEGEWTAGQ